MDISEIFRKATRPIVTVIFAATIAQVVTQGIDAPQWFLGLAIPIILWWFGERTITRAKERSARRSATLQDRATRAGEKK